VTWIWYILQVYHVCVCVSRAHTFSPYAFEHVQTYYRDSEKDGGRCYWNMLARFLAISSKGKLLPGWPAVQRLSDAVPIIAMFRISGLVPTLSLPLFPPLSHPTPPCARVDWPLVCLAYTHVKDGCSCVCFMYMLQLCVCRCRRATAVCTQGTARGKSEKQSAQVAGAQGGGYVDAPRSRCPLRSAPPLVWDPLILFSELQLKLFCCLEPFESENRPGWWHGL